MTNITIHIGEDYTVSLEKRLADLKIAKAELAREIGWSPTQVSRMFTRKMTPRMSNVQKIESAILTIRKRRAATRR